MNTPPAVHPLSILLVDDEAPLRDMIARILKKSGHHVAAVEDGRAAIRELRAQRFDLIITDILMPEADGLEVITAAKQLQPEARVVAMSGGSSTLSAPLCLRLAKPFARGAILRKPFTAQELLATAAGREAGLATVTA